MFTRTSTYTNTTGSWTTVEEAVAQIESGLTSTMSAEDITKINELLAQGDVVENTPTLSADGTSLVFVKTASQHALDVYSALSEGAGQLPTQTSFTRSQSDWVAPDGTTAVLDNTVDIEGE
jgi:hypothetical protein